MKRKTLSARLRFEIFKRDGFVCQYCGAHPPGAILHVDHVVPVKDGGDNEETNLVTACSVCNGGKAAVSLSVVPVALKKKAALIKEREKQLRGYTDICMQQRERLEDESWRIAGIFMDGFTRGRIRRDWFGSIKNFVKQLGVVEVTEAMDIAMASNATGEGHVFRYFCGVCWRKIKGPAP